MEKISIFLDLDGVIADDLTGIRKLGFTSDPVTRATLLQPGTNSPFKRAMYEAVKGTTFYADLPLMPDALRLYNHVYKIDKNPVILTAAPKFGSDEDDFHLNPYWLGAAYHKRNWVETVLLPKAAYARKDAAHKVLCDLAHSMPERIRIDDEHFICTTSSRKYQYMHRKKSEFQILIDDRADNCEAWREAGGIAIQHTDVDDTIMMIDMHFAEAEAA